MLIDDTIVIDILELRVTWLYRGDRLCGKTAEVLVRLDDALEAIAIESTEGLTHLHDQRVDILQCTYRGEVRQEILRVAQTGHLILVMGDITVHVPFPVLIVYQHTANLQFHALVRYRADIAQDGRETSYLLYGNIQQEVVGLLVVSIQRHCQTVLEEAGAQSYIIRGGCLPFQVFVRFVLDDIARRLLVVDNHRTGDDIRRKLVVTDFLVTHCTDRGTQLDEVDTLA